MTEKFIVLGTGCFWCSEAAFSMFDGIIKVLPGYAGGTVENPTYKEVCTDKTGHAEVVKIVYNDDKINLNTILNIFIKMHDPTSLNRQGNDVGTQYRSIIFYNNEEEKNLIENFLNEQQKNYNKPIVTEVKKFDKFYEAEEYHHNYFRNNTSNPYCEFVIKPEVNNIAEEFKTYLKKQY